VCLIEEVELKSSSHKVKPELAVVVKSPPPSEHPIPVVVSNNDSTDELDANIEGENEG
jgi:hypothetical protein